MSIGEKYRKLLTIRKEIVEIDFDNDQVIKDMINLMTNNIEDTINYLKTDCSAEEFSWLSEIFREIVEICPSREFIDELYNLAKKYPEETKKYNVMSFIKEAEQFL